MACDEALSAHNEHDPVTRVLKLFWIAFRVETMKQTLMKMIATIGTAALLGLSAPAGAADLLPVSPVEQSGAFSMLRVGDTGIMCYMEPCPWRGVVRVDPDGAPIRPSAIWSGEEPPPIAGAPADAERVRNAYAQGCVLIEGRMADAVLEVRRVLGDC